MCIEDIFKEVSSRYYDLFKEGDTSFDFFALEGKFETLTQGCHWSDYEREYTRTLINEFNDFSTAIYRLHLLEKIINEYSDEEQYHLRLEFTKVWLYYCLLKPNEFNNSLIFFCQQLCHQANCIVKDNYEDSKKNLKSVKGLNLVSSYWDNAKKLNNLIEKSNAEFNAKTQRFRHRSQHENPPLLEEGLSNLILRDSREISMKEFISPGEEGDSPILQVINDGLVQKGYSAINPESKSTAYRFGYTPPITTEKMLPVLLEERDAMKNKFYAYWDLVQEQDTAIQAVKNCTNS